MGASEFTAVNARLMQTVLRYMEGLRRHSDGDALCEMIERILRSHNRHGPIGVAGFTELYYCLDAYANDPNQVFTARIKARLLQQHIGPYLPDEGQHTMFDHTLSVRESDHPETEDAADMLLQPFPVISTPSTATPSGSPSSGNDMHATQEAVKEGTLNPRPPKENRRANYETLRRSEQDAWRAIYDVVRDFGALKQLWSENVDGLAQERFRLSQKLAEAEQALKLIEMNCEKLRADIGTRSAPERRAPRRPIRLPRNIAPQLVKRDAFLLQLQAEASRIKRTGSSVALAFLGIDGLETMAEQYGEGADVAVFDCYAREILAGFRAYDVIGRQDADTFMILLPDTHQDGAVRALEKAHKRATQTYVSHGNTRFLLPGFFASLTVYSPGEDPAAWLQRGQLALDNARVTQGEPLVVA